MKKSSFILLLSTIVIFASVAVAYSEDTVIQLTDNSSNSAEDGTQKWAFQMGDVRSSPAIGSDGTIYVGSQDNYLYAINPDGTQKWAFAAGIFSKSSPTIGSDGTIYVGSEDTYLYAINPDGTRKWRFHIPNAAVQQSPALGSDGTIYLGSHSRNGLYAINSDGTRKWVFPMTNDAYSPAIGSDGTIYVGSQDNYYYSDS